MNYRNTYKNIIHLDQDPVFKTPMEYYNYQKVGIVKIPKRYELVQI